MNHKLIVLTAANFVYLDEVVPFRKNKNRETRLYPPYMGREYNFLSTNSFPNAAIWKVPIKITFLKLIFPPVPDFNQIFTIKNKKKLASSLKKSYVCIGKN